MDIVPGSDLDLIAPPSPGLHEPPIYINEDYLEDPESLWREIRRGFREREHRRVVQQLPPVQSLSELRRSCGFSQERLAAHLKTNQARLSRVERRPDPRIDWLRDYVEALGGTLHILVRFPTRDTIISFPRVPQLPTSEPRDGCL